MKPLEAAKQAFESVYFVKPMIEAMTTGAVTFDDNVADNAVKATVLTFLRAALEDEDLIEAVNHDAFMAEDRDLAGKAAIQALIDDLEEGR